MHKHSLKVNCSPLVVGQPQNFKPPEKKISPELRLLQDDYSIDTQKWSGHLSLHQAATLDPPYLDTVKALLAEYPESARTKDKYG